MNHLEQKQEVDAYLDAAEQQRDVLRRARNLLAEAKKLGREAKRHQRKVDDWIADAMGQAIDPDAVADAMFRPLPRWNKEAVRQELYNSIDELD